MIYRVAGESTVWVWSEESGVLEVSPDPSRSMVAYRDDWQVALLPDRD